MSVENVVSKPKKTPYMKALFSGKDQNAQTPDELFFALNTEFHEFGPDVCPNDHVIDGLSETTIWPAKTFIK